MESGTYDLDKLGKIKELNYETAVKSFMSYALYFDELDKFVLDSRKLLRGFAPVVVASSEEVKADFLKEIGAVQVKFIEHGMLPLASTLSDLEKVVNRGEAKALEDGIQVLHAELGLIVKKVAAARLPAINPETGAEIVILAVDDKPEMLTTIAGMIGSRYKLISVTSGADAIEAASRHAPSLLLLDIEMPEMNGFELARAIRNVRAHAKIPVVFLTDYSSRENVLEAKALGNCDFLLKPVEVGKLLRKLEFYLAKD
jgi:CheY-like chemotaxis protein